MQQSSIPDAGCWIETLVHHQGCIHHSVSVIPTSEALVPSCSSVWIIREVYSVVGPVPFKERYFGRKLFITHGHLRDHNNQSWEASVFGLNEIFDWISTPGVDVALATCATLTSGAPSGFYPALISPHLQAGPRWLELIRRVFNWIVLPTPSHWALELSTGLRDISSARTTINYGLLLGESTYDARAVWLAMICPYGLASIEEVLSSRRRR